MEQDIRNAVRESYGKIASQGSSCCGSGGACCDSSSASVTLDPQALLQIGRSIGYSEEEMAAVPEGANLGLGCGNPVALASLKLGETVLDLGSGAGFDCFLAAGRVGETGHVIGVDMTAEMLARARQNLQKSELKNLEFRLGEIESLPIADGTVDVVISNCVINLSPDKERVFREVFRVLKPGGRMMVSDIVLLKPLPEAVNNSIEAYVGCIAGASLKDDYLEAIRKAGFVNIEIPGQVIVAMEEIMPGEQVPENTVVSARIAAVKPN